ncbi:hypothetical protein V8E36_007009 [Tilletia maclaganii]
MPPPSALRPASRSSHRLASAPILLLLVAPTPPASSGLLSAWNPKLPPPTTVHSAARLLIRLSWRSLSPLP